MFYVSFEAIFPAISITGDGKIRVDGLLPDKIYRIKAQEPIWKSPQCYLPDADFFLADHPGLVETLDEAIDKMQQRMTEHSQYLQQSSKRTAELAEIYAAIDVRAEISPEETYVSPFSGKVK